MSAEYEVLPLTPDQSIRVLSGAKLFKLVEIVIAGLTERSKGAILEVVEFRGLHGGIKRPEVVHFQQRLAMVSPLHVYVGREVDLRVTSCHVLKAHSAELKMKALLLSISGEGSRWIDLPLNGL